MKFARRTMQNMAATTIVLAILLSGGVYAYSTRGSLAAGVLNPPSPLSDPQHTSPTSTDSSSTSQSEEHHSETSAGSSAHSETQQTSQQSNAQGDEDEQGENENAELHFRLVPADNGKGQGNVNINVDGPVLDGHIEVEKLAESTMYTLFLIATPTTTGTTLVSTGSPTTATTTGTPSCTGTSLTSLGSFETKGEGSGEAELTGTLTPGTYMIGVILCKGSTPVLVSEPTTITLTVVAEDEDEKAENAQGQTTSEESEKHTVQTHTEDKEDEDEIKSAEDSKTIPAEVKVDPSGVSFTQLDPKFSVSASKLDNGLQVSISASDVTGPRVLLVDLKGDQWTVSSLQSLTVTFDGKPISEAASLSQVLSASSTDPARYIVLVTSSGLKLLVSIPHFSLHTIQILPSAASVVNFLAVNGLVLLAGVLVFTAVAVAVFSKRRRFLALLG